MAEEERATAIGVLLDRLRSLGGRAPGSVLTSDDWNGLVDTITTVARLSTEGGVRVPGPAPSPPGELPPGSVGLEELAPEVQNLLRSGPYADHDKLGGRFTLERRLSAATERLSAVEARLDALLATLHRTETDVSRQGSDLRLVDQRVAGTGGLKTEVGDLRKLLGSVRTDVADALALRQELAGVDLGELRARVGELTEFRNAWRDPQGQPLTFAGLDRRLAEVTDRAVTDDELGPILDSRFDRFVVDPGPIRTAVINDLRAEVVAAREELGRTSAAAVAQGLAEVRAGVDAQIDRAVAGRTAALSDELTGIAGRAADARLAAARDELRAETVVLVDDRISRLGPRVAPSELAALDTRLTARIEEVRTAGVSLDAVTALVTPVRVDLGRRIDEVAAGVETNRRGQAELAAALRRERADAAAAESRRLEGLIETRVKRESTERAGAVDAAVQRLDADLRARLAETAQALRAERDVAVAAAVTARTSAIRSELEARIRVVAQDAVAAVESDVVELRGQLRGLDTRLVDLDRQVQPVIRPGRPPIILPELGPRPGGGG
jgi:hypothetical protein